MGQNVLHKVQLLIDGGRRIRIGEDDASVFPVVIFFYNAEILIKRGALVRDAVELRPYFIKRICNIREQDRLIRIKKRQETQRQNIVRPDPGEYLVLSHLILLCQRFYKHAGRRIRVKTERVSIQRVKRFAHFR